MATSDSAPKKQTPGRRILVVDDDPSIRLLCTTTLKNAGYQVLEVEGSSEAMTLYTTMEGPIDLLLTDLLLPPQDFRLSSSKDQYPRVNGHDLVQQALSLKKELRVLFMSSHTLTSLAGQGIVIPPDRFLGKPFSADELVNQVASVLAAPPIRVADPAAASGPGKDVPWFG